MIVIAVIYPILTDWADTPVEAAHLSFPVGAGRRFFTEHRMQTGANGSDVCVQIAAAGVVACHCGSEPVPL